MRKENLIKIDFSALLLKLKIMENDENFLSNNILNGLALILRRGCPQCMPVKEAALRMNREVHSHHSMTT